MFILHILWFGCLLSGLNCQWEISILNQLIFLSNHELKTEIAEKAFSIVQSFSGSTNDFVVFQAMYAPRQRWIKVCTRFPHRPWWRIRFEWRHQRKLRRHISLTIINWINYHVWGEFIKLIYVITLCKIYIHFQSISKKYM